MLTSRAPLFVRNTLVVSVCTLMMVLTATSCTQSRHGQAQELYDRAIQAFADKRMGQAKFLTDSIHKHYADVVDIYSQSRELRQRIVAYEGERTLAYLDSMLSVRQTEQKRLMELVVIDDAQATVPVYVAKTQQTRRAYNRSHLRATVDANGNFSISSNYTGERHIHHNSVTVSSNNEDFVRTAEVTDEAFVHEFDDDEQVWETVKYTGQEAATLATFICQNKDNYLRADYKGPRAHYILLMTDVDKQAVHDVWMLSRSLRETIKIRGMIRATRRDMKRNGVDK